MTRFFTLPNDSRQQIIIVPVKMRISYYFLALAISGCGGELEAKLDENDDLVSRDSPDDEGNKEDLVPRDEEGNMEELIGGHLAQQSGETAISSHAEGRTDSEGTNSLSSKSQLSPLDQLANVIERYRTKLSSGEDIDLAYEEARKALSSTPSNGIEEVTKKAWDQLEKSHEAALTQVAVGKDRLNYLEKQFKNKTHNTHSLTAGQLEAAKNEAFAVLDSLGVLPALSSKLVDAVRKRIEAKYNSTAAFIRRRDLREGRARETLN